MERTHGAAKPLKLVLFVLLLGVAACSADGWQRGSGVPDPYKNECRSEGCAM